MDAESSLRAGALEHAISSCRRAGPYLSDCVRHLWRASTPEGESPDPALLARLAKEFPSEAPYLDANSPVFRDMASRQRIRAEAVLSMGLCQGEDGEDCPSAVKTLLDRRWRRALREDESAAEMLCAGVATDVFPSDAELQAANLPRWERGGELDGVVARAREELCGRPATPE
jgi:hypothetical protein